MAKGKKKPKQSRDVICSNKRTARNYEIADTWEAGIALVGTEIKSIRAGKVNIADAYGVIKEGEVFLQNMDIAPYDNAAHFNHDPRRLRKLLLHRREIDKLAAKVIERGFTLIPLDLHFKDGRVKVTVALAKGKKNYDDRERIAKEQHRRELRQLHRGEW